jgi:hypothetical protein
MAKDSIFLSRGATVAFGVIKGDEFEKVSDDVTIEKEPESDGRFECSAEAEISEVDKEFILAFDNAHGFNRFAVMISMYPKTSFRRKGWWYLKKYQSATSIRRARKYARIIGKQQDRTGKHKFNGVDIGRTFIAPRCTLEKELDEQGNVIDYSIVAETAASLDF